MQEAGLRLGLEWELRLSRMGELLVEAKRTGPDENIAASLVDQTSTLLELAQALTTDSEFRESMEAVLSDHADLIQNHAELSRYAHARLDGLPEGVSPSEAMGIVSRLRCQLESISKVAVNIKNSGNKLAAAEPDRHLELIEDLVDLKKERHERTETALSILKTLFPEAGSPDVETDDAAEPDQCDPPESESPPTHHAGGTSVSVPELNLVTETLNATEPKSVKKATAADLQSSEAGVVPDSAGEPDEPDAIHATPEQDPSRPDSSSPRIEANESGPTEQSDLPDEGPSEESASALRSMLSEGRFARAYWLARADKSLLEASLVGAFCEAARIAPGDTCPGILTQFFDELVNKATWNEEEKLLLCGAMLGPCLFLDPIPQGIYVLLGKLSFETKSMADLSEKVLQPSVYQNIKIRTDHFGTHTRDAALSSRIAECSSRAGDFLERLPRMRSMYVPANAALRHLYRSGSTWHSLHVIVAENQQHRAGEIRGLCADVDPSAIVATLHDDPGSGLQRPLDGSVRAKLIRHLHSSLVHGREWLRLVEMESECDNRGDQERRRINALLKVLKELLPGCLDDLNSGTPLGAANALFIVLSNLQTRREGREVALSAGLAGELLPLAGLPLDDDLEPIDVDPDVDPGVLRSAILGAEEAAAQPQEVLAECLSRHEYRRVKLLIDTYSLGEEAEQQYRRTVEEARTSLLDELLNLEIQVEDAYLLGQLWAESSDKSESSSHDQSAIERTGLLATIRDSITSLQDTAGLEPELLRDLVQTVASVSGRIQQLTSRRRTEFTKRLESVIEELPDNEQGSRDREYLRKAFQECQAQKDDVAAFELLERGLAAVRQGEAIPQASVDKSTNLHDFLAKADKYRELVSIQERVEAFDKKIIQGKTVGGIAFGQLDVPRRKEVVAALRTWRDLSRLPIASMRREIPSRIMKLCQFLGLPLDGTDPHVRDVGRHGFAHVVVHLARPVTSSPIPAFGSAWGTSIDLVFIQKRQEPEQVADYIRGQDLHTSAVLVLVCPPLSPKSRIAWRRHCAREDLTLLPLDQTLLVHLCGQRNRLSALLEIGLLSTWSRPYITKGENVAREMFVGRRSEAASLVNPHGGCIVFGGRQLGKSALLRNVLNEYHDPIGKRFVVYLDIDDLGLEPQTHADMMAVFWRRVHDQLRQVGAIETLPPEKLRRSSHLTEEVPRLIEKALAENEQSRIILLLDESDDLLDCDSGRDFALVRRLRALMSENDRRFKVVFAGLQSVQRYNNWENHPFAQLGKELVISPLPARAAQELIVRPLRALGFTFESPTLILRILSQANYHPGLIQIICYRLIENLYNALNASEADRLEYTITQQDVLAVERDSAVMEEIRNRFDWTLDLDDRYKVLTYALVLKSDPSARRAESEFMELGQSWWPAVFEVMDVQALRAVLDEMVGLGVLLPEFDQRLRQYRLRSPNLLRLLGSKQTIEAELERIISQDRVSRTNPRNFHQIVDKKPQLFGPLTKEQEGQISNNVHPFQLTLVTGSEALGLSDVPRQFIKLFNDLSEIEILGEQKIKKWKSITLGSSSVLRSGDSFIEYLVKVFRRRDRNHMYAIVRLDLLDYGDSISLFCDRITREMARECRNQSKGHVILLIDPARTWEWLNDEYRRMLLSNSRITSLEIHRWSDGAIANALDNVGIRTGSKRAGNDVFKTTAGFHGLVNEGLRRVKSERRISATDLVKKWAEVCDEWLAEDEFGNSLQQLGLRGGHTELEACAWKLLECMDSDDDTFLLSSTSFELASESLTGESKRLLEEHRVRVRDWMRIMDLARPGKSQSIPMVVAPFVASAVGSKER